MKTPAQKISHLGTPHPETSWWPPSSLVGPRCGRSRVIKGVEPPPPLEPVYRPRPVYGPIPVYGPRPVYMPSPALRRKKGLENVYSAALRHAQYFEYVPPSTSPTQTGKGFFKSCHPAQENLQRPSSFILGGPPMAVIVKVLTH